MVFNTGMTGYEEILTDPSYYGQIVTMTYPLIRNYGINLEDVESKSPKVKGFIVREKCDYPNNFRCEMDLEGYLKQNKIIGLEGIDTRALTKMLRNNGTMKGIIATKERYTIEGEGQRVAVMDFGIKENILRSLKQRNCKLTIFPTDAKAKEILNVNPDLIFLSNGPGNPEDLPRTSTFGISLGGKTGKLKFGHRGCDHPVKDIEENKVYITLQNHGYYVNELPILSARFHPEACPGPKDIDAIFDKFLSLI